jgi:hypothetical protein
MKTEIKETSKMPSFILMLFGIQLIVFLFLFINTKKIDLDIFYVLLPTSLILGVTKMTIILNKTMFKYRLFPLHLNYKEIEWKEIKQIQISKIDALTDFSGWGLRYSKKYGWGYIFSNEAILLTFKNDKKITITIKSKTEIVNFLTENKIPFNANP